MRIEELSKLVQPILDEMDIELVDLQILGSGGRTIIRIYADQENGISLDTCTKASRAIAAELDRMDPIKSQFVLEVSSPGLDRPLKTKRDFEKSMGKKVKIKYLDGEKPTRIRGIIQQVNDETVTLDVDQELVQINYKNIELAKLVIEF
jgi:ribosome maturation factor RimP